MSKRSEQLREARDKIKSTLQSELGDLFENAGGNVESFMNNVASHTVTAAISGRPRMVRHLGDQIWLSAQDARLDVEDSVLETAEKVLRLGVRFGSAFLRINLTELLGIEEED